MTNAFENNEKNNPHGLKTGDIVIGYYKGYHKITNINWAKGMSSCGLVYYVTFSDKTMKFGKTEKCCGIDWCSPAQKHLADEILRLNKIQAFLFPMNNEV